MKNPAAPRNPAVIAGCIREHVERLQAKFGGESYSVDRLAQLCNELDESLNLKQFSDSLALVKTTKDA